MIRRYDVPVFSVTAVPLTADLNNQQTAFENVYYTFVFLMKIESDI